MDFRFPRLADYTEIYLQHPILNAIFTDAKEHRKSRIEADDYNGKEPFFNIEEQKPVREDLFFMRTAPAIMKYRRIAVMHPMPFYIVMFRTHNVVVNELSTFSVNHPPSAKTEHFPTCLRYITADIKGSRYRIVYRRQPDADIIEYDYIRIK